MSRPYEDKEMPRDGGLAPPDICGSKAASQIKEQ
jgi:hypothetical protein